MIIFSLAGCTSGVILVNNPNLIILDEYDVKEYEMAAPMNAREMEISSLCWAGDNLLILPQYPHKFGNNIFSVNRSLIERLRFKEDAVTGKKIKMEYTGDYSFLKKNGCGLEAIAVSGDNVFLLAEMVNKIDGTFAYLLKGRFFSKENKIIVNTENKTTLKTSYKIKNLGFETLTIFNNKLIAIEEINGKNIVANPKVKVFDFDLKLIDEYEFPNIEYRITDATAVDSEGVFYVTNYFYPGERDEIKPAEDSLIYKYGIGKTHQTNEYLERIIELKIVGKKIIINSPPYYLKMDDYSEGRNWEGIEMLDKNIFILSADYYPKSIFSIIHIK